jgi:saccharopine dehydrogenase-like NADP-dependent oxidoreductase
MQKIAVVGCGKVGRTVIDLLASTGEYRVTGIDPNPRALASAAAIPNVELATIEVTATAALASALRGHAAVINAAPFHATRSIASAAASAHAHYLDLTEDTQSTLAVTEIARDASRAVIPQCGLAPGFVSIAGHALAQRFSQVDTLRLRVGALPQFPSNALGYNLTWSVDGVINEYLQPCEAIADGQRVLVPPLEELEHFGLDGVRYEAFNTSGGLGSLAKTLAGRVRTLNYRTIRYPGHRDAMQLLLRDLRFSEHTDELRTVLERALPETSQDIVVIFLTASGLRNGRSSQESIAIQVRAREFSGHWRTAIALTTAASVCAVLDLLLQHRLPQRGLVRQEDIPLREFLANRFGSVYRLGESIERFASSEERQHAIK